MIRVTPDYLAIGHVCKDVLSGGRVAAGGTVTYSALTAQRLGLQAAVVTACAPQDEYLLDTLRDEGVWVHLKPSAATTTFQNTYDPTGNRVQVLDARADLLIYGDVPDVWRSAPIVHLGPVAQELSFDMPSLFPDCLLGVTPQGWLRSWDSAGHVTQSAWPIPGALQALPPRAILILSMEDLGHNGRMAVEYVKLATTVVMTNGAEAALIFVHSQQPSSVSTHPVESVDPTGAGDVFATALLVRYRETHDLIEATHFAHSVAARAIMGEGTSSIPRRDGLDPNLR